MENPSKPGLRWDSADILELAIDGTSSHVWIGGQGSAFDRIESARHSARASGDGARTVEAAAPRATTGHDA